MAHGPEGDSPLTTAEVDALRRALEGAAQPEARVVGGRSGKASDSVVLRYDLVGGARGDSDQLPGLELLHERFARELASEFRRLIGADGIFTPQQLRLPKFAQLYASLEVPTALVVVDFKGLGCSAILNMDVDLMLHFLDLMMGGQGGRVIIDNLGLRGFTATETGLIDHLVGVFSRALSRTWSEVTEVSLSLIRVATDPRHVALYAAGELMVEMPTLVEWDDVSGMIQMILPMTYLRPFEDQLSRTATPDHVLTQGALAGVMARKLLGVPAEVSALLGRTVLTMRAIVALEKGDVVRLDADPGEPAEIRVEGIPKLLGTPAVEHGNLAISLIGEIPPDPEAAR